MPITCGIDWAEDHHDVVLMDENGRILQSRRINAGVSGFTELLELIATHGGSSDETPVALETDKNLLVLALIRSIHVPSPGIGSATFKPARSRITSMPPSWPTSCARTATGTGRCPR